MAKDSAYRIVIADVNMDNYPDILLVHGVKAYGPGTTQRNRMQLFLNVGTRDGTSRSFRDVTPFSGINSNPDPTQNGRFADIALLADVDNDGDPDLLTGIWDTDYDCVPNEDVGDRAEVLLNDGKGHFSLRKENGLHELGIIPAATFSALDYDLDGNLDIFIGTHFPVFADSCTADSSQNLLMRGAGDGTFTDVSGAAGLGKSFNPLFGSNITDWNNDGYPDILTAPYEGGTAPAQLWKNNGNGTFTDVGAEVGYTPHWMPGNRGQAMVLWNAHPFDYDSDGDMDLLMLLVNSGNDSAEVPSCIFVNGGAAEGYRLRPDLTLIRKREPPPAHCGDHYGAFTDFDNDGRIDLILTQNMYMPATDHAVFLRQNEGGIFEDITETLGLPELRSAADVEPFDYDLDGDEDVLILRNNEEVRILRNDIGNKNSYTAIKLIPPAGVNGSAVGARITVSAAGSTQLREVEAGKVLFGGQQPFILNVGLGSAQTIDSIVVEWPNTTHSQTVVHNPPIRTLLNIAGDGLHQTP